ncbi:hypothetical protein BH09PSE4_BH09PSE4_06580 [soil metagenome]
MIDLTNLLNLTLATVKAPPGIPAIAGAEGAIPGDFLLFAEGSPVAAAGRQQIAAGGKTVPLDGTESVTDEAPIVPNAEGQVAETAQIAETGIQPQTYAPQTAPLKFATSASAAATDTDESIGPDADVAPDKVVATPRRGSARVAVQPDDLRNGNVAEPTPQRGREKDKTKRVAVATVAVPAPAVAILAPTAPVAPAPRLPEGNAVATSPEGPPPSADPPRAIASARGAGEAAPARATLRVAPNVAPDVDRGEPVTLVATTGVAPAAAKLHPAQLRSAAISTAPDTNRDAPPDSAPTVAAPSAAQARVDAPRAAAPVPAAPVAARAVEPQPISIRPMIEIAASPVTAPVPAHANRIAAAQESAAKAVPLTPAVVQAAPEVAIVQPAAIAFGAAIRAAAIAEDRRPVIGRAARGGDLATIATPLQPVDGIAVAAPVTAAQQGALDMRDHRWMQGMIDHIERVRDGLDAGDTRIRLAPDALGNVGVSIRTDGDTLHVRFTAPVPETRALLAEAQPRLAEIAAERGLKLGQSSVDAGQNPQGDAQHRAFARANPVPRAPEPASNDISDTDTDTDRRLA